MMASAAPSSAASTRRVVLGIVGHLVHILERTGHHDEAFADVLDGALDQVVIEWRIGQTADVREPQHALVLLQENRRRHGEHPHALQGQVNSSTAADFRRRTRPRTTS